MGSLRHTRAWRGSRRAAALVTAGLGLGVGAALQAATIPTTASFSVGATVQNGCFVNGSTSQTTGVNFGTLDFGAHPALTAGSFTVTASGASQALLYCTPNTTVQVTLNGGLHSLGNQRYLANGTGATLAYAIALGTSPTVPLLPGVAASLPLSSTAVAVPLVGSIAYTAAAPSGVYTDTVQVTVSW